MLKKQVCIIVMLIMSICMFSFDTNAQEVVEGASGTYEEHITENRNALVGKMMEKSEDGSTTVIIGNYSTLNYQYNFSCSENNFSAGYKKKEDGWSKVFSLTYNYETDSVNINFMQVKSSYFYAANATFAASEYTKVDSIVFKDATGGNYSGMCVTYAELFAEVVLPDINNKMITLFDSSFCKIGFTSYAHNHSGGSATCLELAKCKICDKEYGELGEHETEIVNVKQETCYEEGYTGDHICRICNQVIAEGVKIPKKERIEATGKFALLKSFLLEKGQIDDDGNKYFYDIAMVSDKIGAISSITYIEDEAKFQFAYGSINNNNIESTVAMYMEENGSKTVTVDYSYAAVSLYASSTFDVGLYTPDGKVYFEKTSANILDNSQIQNVCNAELKSAFIGWDIVLIDNLGLDVNMANLGFTSYEEAGTHTWDVGNVTTNATCEKNGIKIYTCTICGDTRTEDIQKSNSHTWDLGHITKEPTTTSEGEKTFTCNVCKTVRIEKVSKLTGNTNVNNSNNSNNNNNNIKKSQKIKVVTNKKISAKKVKKKAQSFKLSAKSTSGSKVKYKLAKGNSKIKFVASSGKITVKKGTKKGTYKIKVKMTVSGNNKYKAYSTTKTITIKVK